MPPVVRIAQGGVRARTDMQVHSHFHVVEQRGYARSRLHSEGRNYPNEHAEGRLLAGRDLHKIAVLGYEQCVSGRRAEGMPRASGP